jgi:transcription initiation factor TFIIIB Brf1 subunit/transcription initiation factor TFIIB
VGGKQCDDCKKTEFASNRAEGTIVCTSCGLVQESRVIDETSEWRNFSNENSDGAGSAKNRCGGKLNPYYSDFGLSTMVAGNNASKEL